MDQELVYKWYCRQQAEGDVPEENLNLEKEVKSIDYPAQPLVDKEVGYEGCFGNGFGMLRGKGKTIFVGHLAKILSLLSKETILQRK